MPREDTSTDIRQLISDIVGTWRAMIESKGVELTCFIAEDITGNHQIETQKFHACLNTLLSNAAHYTDEGRVHVHVTASPVKTDSMQDLTFIIADTGRGISNEQQIDIISGQVHTRLHDVIEIAKTMGGKISFNSTHGRGSEFTFEYLSKVSDITTASSLNAETSAEDNSDELIDIVIDYADIEIHAPVETPVKNETPPDTFFDPDNLRGLRVLIVDDVSSNQDVIKLFLKPEGCFCICSAAGEKALETLKTQSVDLILMDIRMPGMNGIETTQAIRNSDLSSKDVPIIALTADGSAKTNAACMAAGADLFLTKPVLCRDLLESMRFVRRFQDHTDSAQGDAAQDAQPPQTSVA